MNEYELHRGIALWLNEVLPPGSVMHHSPGEGRRHVAFASKLKQMGMQAGWPDLELFIPALGFSENQRKAPIFLEIKTQKGKVRSNQTEIHTRLRGSGCYVFVVRSIREVESCLSELLTLDIRAKARLLMQIAEEA